MSTDAAKTATQQLEEASQQHEFTIVIDLGMDRLIRWIGVYLVLALAVIAKLSDVIGSNLSCYPTNRSLSVSGEFVSFATTFCWENSHDLQEKNECHQTTFISSVLLLKNPSFPKNFIQWFPYILLLQSLIFVIPWAFWHFRVGGRLMGHLKFMQLLLSSIFQKLQDLEVGYYDSSPYDEESSHFDGRRNEVEDKSNTNKSNEPVQTGVELTNVATAESINQQSEPLVEGSVSDKSKSSSGSNNKNKSTFIDRISFGEMRDRHLFSMMCYENFASLHHLPYILSVFQLNRQEENNKPSEPPEQFYPTTEAILYKFCHKRNFDNVFLVRIYLWKHIITGIGAMAMFAVMTWFLVLNAHDITSLDSFVCQLPYDDVCMLCTIQRIRDEFAIFCCDYVIMFMLFTLSLGNWLVVRSSSNKATSCFFNHMMTTSNVALRAAALSRELKENSD